MSDTHRTTFKDTLIAFPAIHQKFLPSLSSRSPFVPRSSFAPRPTSVPLPSLAPRPSHAPLHSRARQPSPVPLPSLAALDTHSPLGLRSPFGRITLRYSLAPWLTSAFGLRSLLGPWPSPGPLSLLCTSSLLGPQPYLGPHSPLGPARPSAHVCPSASARPFALALSSVLARSTALVYPLPLAQASVYTFSAALTRLPILFCFSVLVRTFV